MQHLHGVVANPQYYDVYARICVCVCIYGLLLFYLFAHIHEARAQAHTMLRVRMVYASSKGECPLS